MTAKPENSHWGSMLEDFLEEEGTREEETTASIKRVIAWQLSEEMKKTGDHEEAPGRTDADEPRPDRPYPRPRQGNVTIETLQSAAALLGRQLRLKLV